jgi:hypothetical protein
MIDHASDGRGKPLQDSVEAKVVLPRNDCDSFNCSNGPKLKCKWRTL